MIYIGIDTAPRGSIAAIDDESKIVVLQDLPVIHDQLTWIDSKAMRHLLLQCTRGGPAEIAIESSDTTPGIVSRFDAGVHLGSLLTVTQQVPNLRRHVVRAPEWKARFGVDLDKNSALDMARKLFPKGKFPTLHPRLLMKSHRRANAVLLAEYIRRACCGEATA